MFDTKISLKILNPDLVHRVREVQNNSLGSRIQARLEFEASEFEAMTTDHWMDDNSEFVYIEWSTPHPGTELAIELPKATLDTQWEMELIL